VNYLPTYPGENITPQWLYDELQRIATALTAPGVLNFDIQKIAPAKPQDGMFAMADGTAWNPGAGAGPYVYFTGAWHKLY